MTLAAGARLGPYEILSPLGAGGMGEVYRAKDPRLGREVAIKVLPASFSQDPDRLRRFEQEARAASALNHPNILTIHDIGTHDGSPYVVSELLEGETLRGRLVGALSPRKAIEYALPIAHGLAAAHEKGIVHRDLKPENIFVTKDGRVKILDFGLAKLTRPETAGSPLTQAPTATAGTEPGVLLGTLGYMSPEQVRGKPADARSDIFSFGAILYEMLSGKRAFHGDSTADTISAILTKEPPDLSITNRNISPGLERVVRHCLEKGPEQRFQSARDLAFDLEALSDVSAPALAPRARPRARTLRLGAVLVAVLLGLVAAALLLWPRAKAIESLAVLPFSNAGADPNAEYLSDGITDALINSLSQLPNVTVMSRDSVSGYKKRDIGAQAAGRELSVQAVLKGKLLQRADDLLITAELVDVRRNSHLWGGQFHRKLSEIQTVQEEMAGQISAKLRGRLSGEEKKRLTKRYTENAEAYQLYLKGRYFWEKRTEDSLKKSIDYFNQAIEKDPAYGRAYAGLAEAYSVLSSWGVMPPKESYPKARAAAAKALEIDDSLVEAHACLGLLTSYDWAWSAAEREFKRAIELNPNYATAHHWYGMLLASLGRSDEAIAELHRAKELDPLSRIIQANNARISLYARQYDRALEEARKTIEQFPDYFNGPLMLGRAHEAKGMLEQAIREYREAVNLGGGPLALSALGGAYALSGRRVEAQTTLEELKSLATRRYVPPYYIATIYQDLGEKDRAFEWLEKAYADGSWDLVFLKVNPVWDPVRSDPRLADLLRRLKLAS